MPRKRKPRSAEKYKLIREEARALVNERINRYNQVYGMSVGRICIRNQKTRWGSCSQKGNLNFNWRIVHLPPAQADYLVVHELCHLKEFNHSKKFWELVALSVPDYTRLRKELRRIPL